MFYSLKWTSDCYLYTYFVSDFRGYIVLRGSRLCSRVLIESEIKEQIMKKRDNYYFLFYLG